MSRVNLLIRNTIYNFGSSAWIVLLHFFTTPYVVSRLGVEGYAIYSLLYMIIGYFSFLELGLGRTIIKFVSELMVRRDFVSIQGVLGTAFVVFITLGLFGGGLIALLNETFFLRVLKISPGFQEVARTAFYIGAVGFLISMPAQIVSAIPKGLQRFDISNKIDVVFGTLQSLLVVLLLYLGFNLQILILANVAVTLLSLATYLVIIHHLLPGVALAPSFDRASFRRIIGFSSYVAVDNVLITLSARINSFILGAFRPVAAVAYYSIPDNLSGKVSFIPRSIGQTIYPSFSELNAQGDRVKLRDLYVRSTKYMVTLTIPFLILFVFMAEKFLLFWLGGDFALQARLPLQLMGTTQVLTFWAYSSMEGTRALGRPEISTSIQVIVSILNICLCFLLIPGSGLTGAVFAYSLPRFIFVPVLVFWVARKNFELSPGRFLAAVCARPLLAFLPCAALGAVAAGYARSLVQLILLFVGLYLLYMLVSLFLVLDRVDRASFLNFARKHLGR